MNRGIKIALCMLLACTFLLSSWPLITHADVPDVQFSKGKITFNITSTTASSGIRFKTVGWTVRRESSPSCTYDSQGKHCDPTGPGSARVVGLEQTGQYPPNPAPGNPVTTFFEVPEAKVTKALTDNGLEGIKQNDQLYLYAIMTVTRNGTQIGGPYYTLDAIKKAQPWAHPDDLDNYFGIPVTYDSPSFPVDIVCKTEAGTVITDPSCTFRKGEFLAGEEIEHTFAETLESNGKSYEIVRSYVVSKNNPEKKQYVREIGQDNLLDRHISVFISGADIVAEYRESTSLVTVTSRIEAPTEVAGSVTEVEGDFIFEAKSPKSLKSYEITSIQNAALTQPTDKSGTLTGTSATKTLPIKILFTSGNSVTVKITVVVKDVDGNMSDSTSNHTVRKSGSDGGPTPGDSKEASVMDPEVSAVIQADARGAEKFDVLKGIPTSESLYVNALAKSYLYRNTFLEMIGSKSYPIQVSKTYTLRWTERVSGPPDENGNPTTRTVSRSDTQTVTKNYTVQRKYSFWLINRLEVYSIQKANFTNYALPSGGVILQPAGYTPPSVSAAHDASLNAHITDPVYSNVRLPGETISGGSSRPSVPNEDWKSEAEEAVGKIKVKNDSLVFNGGTIMDNRVVEEKAPTPGAIPAPTTIGQNVLYGSGYLIDSSKTNKANQPSSGTISYALIKGIGGGENKSFPIKGINPVTVHTPVVNYASVSDDQAHNQKTKPTAGRSALILDRPFTLTVPTSGQHREIKGYGNRDYAKYTRDKQVWFPFDVYAADRKTFIPKETWTSIPVAQTKTTFYLPVWVDEGQYEVLFRTFAENCPSGFTTQMNANLDLSHHVATQVVPVEVIGRLYDFRITDIADFQWETVFRKQKGSATPTGNAYWVGMKDIDGAARGNKQPFTLPVRQGSHPEAGKKNVAVKTGYHVKFEVMTKGNMFGSGDGIRITPTFYFVDRKGKNRQEVDLYYHSDSKKFVRIGSSEDVERRNITLDTRLRNVAKQELIDTAGSLWALNGSTGMKQSFINQYLKSAQKPTYVGGYDIMLLPSQLRTFVGNINVPSGVNAARANASVQHWFGEYSIPAAAYAIPKGFNLAEYGRKNGLNDKSSIFLRDGYIIVNFNLETIRNKDLNNPHLQYIHGLLNNQWQMEGFQRSFTDPYSVTFQLKDGDVVFYHANLSSYDDYGTGGTH